MQDFQPRRPIQDAISPRLSPHSEEYEKELQLMQDTHLLLSNLAEREKATVGAILDGLYEVGSARLINREIGIRALRGPLKGIARFSKPVFRLFAWRWFKRNCPGLITNWLYQQVRFGEKLPTLPIPDDTTPIDVLPVQESLPPLVEKQAEEILALRGKITLLTTAVLILALLFGINILV